MTNWDYMLEPPPEPDCDCGDDDHCYRCCDCGEHDEEPELYD